MHCLAELSVMPLDGSLSMSQHIATCQNVLEEAGVTHQMHAFGTNVEGEWEEVMNAVQRCHDKLHADGVPRVYTTLKLETRTDRTESLQEKIDHVYQKAG